MIQKLFITIILLLTSRAVLATDAATEIRAVLSAQVAAWNRGDIDGFMNGYLHSNQVEFISGNKVTRGWQIVRDGYHKKYGSREAMGILKFDDLQITMSQPNLAMVHGHWELTRTTDHPHGSFILILRRQPEGWRIIRDNTS